LIHFYKRKMPMMMLNLRAKPQGMESHRGFLKEESMLYRDNVEGADLRFICQGDILMAHQALFVRLSTVLGVLLKEQSCSHTRQEVTVILDIPSVIMESVLDLVYTGGTSISPDKWEQIKSAVKMLGLEFRGGFEKVKSLPGWKKYSSTKRPSLAPSPVESKRPKLPNRDNSVMDTVSNNTIVTATERMNMHVALTLELKDAPRDKTAPCKMPGCGLLVTYEQLSEHFLKHETEDIKELKPKTVVNGQTAVNGQAVPFPCVACGINFRFRRELDTHTKRKHGAADRESLKEKLEILSDSSDDEQSLISVDSNVPSTPRSATPSGNYSNATTSSRSVTPNTNSLYCPLCYKTVPSTWHLPPSKHDCKKVSPTIESTNKCHVCLKLFKTVKALNCHILAKHPLAPSASSGINTSTLDSLPASLLAVGGQTSSLSPLVNQVGEVRPENAPLPNWKKFGCQICTKRFPEFCQLRTHYTLYHFWDQLSQDHEDLGQDCSICQLRYPTQDHLVQHMGNFHSLVDRYLIKKGLRIISSEKTIKLLNWNCTLCQAQLPSSSALKAHLSVKHYARELAAEFPVESSRNKKCPKCYKQFEGSSVSTVIGHVGSFHDEVLKYAANILEMDKDDRDIVPVDDFDDEAVGIPINSIHMNGTFKASSPQKSPGRPPMKKDLYPSGPFDCLTCQICLDQFQSARTLKIHYIRHYQASFQSQFFSVTCPFCVDRKFPDVISAQKHVATDHSNQSLIPMMEKDGLWVDKSVILNSGDARLKRLDIKVKKVDRSVWDKISTPEEQAEKIAPYVSRHSCPVVSCSRSVETRDQLLIHLAVSHFWQRIDKQYGLEFKLTGGTVCPICKNEVINPNKEKSVFFKHLAVVHEVVMKYLEGGEENVSEAPTVSSPVVQPSPIVTNKPKEDTDDEESDEEVENILRKRREDNQTASTEPADVRGKIMKAFDDSDDTEDEDKTPKTKPEDVRGKIMQAFDDSDDSEVEGKTNNTEDVRDKVMQAFNDSDDSEEDNKTRENENVTVRDKIMKAFSDSDESEDDKITKITEDVRDKIMQAFNDSDDSD